MWGGGGDAGAAAAEPSATRRTLDGPWEVEVEATLEDDWGDLAAPAARRRDLGARASRRTARGVGAGARDVRPARALGRAGGRRRAAGAGAECRRLAGRVVAVARHPQGPDARRLPRRRAAACPRSSCDFGPVAAGEARPPARRDPSERRARAPTSRSARARPSAPGSTAAPVALDGARVPGRGAGGAGGGRGGARPAPDARPRTSARCAPTSRSSPTSRATRGPSGCGPPAASPRARSSRSAPACRCRPSRPAAEVLVGANGPCRVLVDGVEVGRQGGFDPYAETRRGPPAALRPAPGTCAPASTSSASSCSTLGRNRPAALLDGLVQTAAGTVAVRSGAGWTASARRRRGRRSTSASTSAATPRTTTPGGGRIRCPDGAWLEPGRRNADAGAPVTVTADRAVATQRLRVTAPPGATEMPDPARARLPRHGDGRRTRAPARDGVAALDGRRPGAGARSRSSRRRGLSGGALLTGPVAFTVGPGEMELVDWQAAGLPNHSGGVRYRRRHRAAPGDAGASTSARSAARRRCSSTARAPACASARRTRSTSAGGSAPTARRSRSSCSTRSARTSTRSARRPTCSRASGARACSAPSGCS